MVGFQTSALSHGDTNRCESFYKCAFLTKYRCENKAVVQLLIIFIMYFGHNHRGR